MTIEASNSKNTSCNLMTPEEMLKRLKNDESALAIAYDKWDRWCEAIATELLKPGSTNILSVDRSSYDGETCALCEMYMDGYSCCECPISCDILWNAFHCSITDYQRGNSESLKFAMNAAIDLRDMIKKVLDEQENVKKLKLNDP